MRTQKRTANNLNQPIAMPVFISTEEALRLSEERNRALLQAIPDMMFVVDRHGYYVDVHSNTPSDLPTAASKHIGKHTRDFVSPALADLFLAANQRVLTTGRMEIVEYTLPFEEGERIFEARIVPCGSDKVLSIVRNITERKQTEAAIRLLNEQIQHASQLKDEFLKNISHEFRTPLTVILTLSESLNSARFGAMAEQQSNAVQRIQRQSRNLLEMVNNLLEMATLLSGSVELHCGPVSLSDLCSHVLYMAQESLTMKQLSASYQIDPCLKIIDADERRLGQIIQILLNNAIKFTPEGGKIGIDVVARKACNRFEIIVWDTGVGLQPEDSRRLFQPFAQADTTLSRRHEGAGLGLALASHLTEMHNGTIMVESQPGQGARFIISLPWSIVKP